MGDDLSKWTIEQLLDAMCHACDCGYYVDETPNALLAEARRRDALPRWEPITDEYYLDGWEGTGMEGNRLYIIDTLRGSAEIDLPADIRLCRLSDPSQEKNDEAM